MHLADQGPVLVDSSPRLRSQVQERAGAAATAPADSLDDLGVRVGQLRQGSSQLLLVSAGVIVSEYWSLSHTQLHPVLLPRNAPWSRASPGCRSVLPQKSSSGKDLPMVCFGTHPVLTLLRDRHE